MALPSSSFSAASISGYFGCSTVLTTAQAMSSANPCRNSLLCDVSWSDCSSESRGGRSVVVSSPIVQVVMFSGRDRNSIHIQAASCCSLSPSTMRLSPATVVAQPASPRGSGALAHFPSMSGNSRIVLPANQFPAMYMADFPLANVTRPSHESVGR
jgi:hypothetical protein